MLVRRPPSQCDGGKGPEVTGVVRMPNGRVARTAGGLERLAESIVGVAQALSGGTSPVGRGTQVQLVESYSKEQGLFRRADPKSDK